MPRAGVGRVPNLCGINLLRVVGGRDGGGLYLDTLEMGVLDFFSSRCAKLLSVRLGFPDGRNS